LAGQKKPEEEENSQLKKKKNLGPSVNTPQAGSEGKRGGATGRGKKSLFLVTTIRPGVEKKKREENTSIWPRKGEEQKSKNCPLFAIKQEEKRKKKGEKSFFRQKRIEKIRVLEKRKKRPHLSECHAQRKKGRGEGSGRTACGQRDK